MQWKEVHVDAGNGLAAFGPTTETRASPFFTWAGSYFLSLLFFLMVFFSVIENQPSLALISAVSLLVYFGITTWAINILGYEFSLTTFLLYSILVYTISIYLMGEGFSWGVREWALGLHILPVFQLCVVALTSNLKINALLIRGALEVVGTIYKFDTKEKYVITHGKDIYIPIIKGTPFRVSYELNSEKSKVKKIELLHTQYEKKGIGGFLTRYAYYVHVKLSHELKHGESLTIIAQ